jgi:transcriptional regulator with PAS, ATPase and Fis domain
MTLWKQLSQNYKHAQITLIKEQLEKNKNKSQAAKAIGISRQRLNGLLVQHKIETKKE